MAENGSSLFRKSTLERVSSPDQLNEYIKVTNPNLIVMLVGVFVVLISGIIWAFSGIIPKTANMEGVVATDTNGNRNVYCFVPFGTSKRLSPGMEVQISPDYADREQYGYIKGIIKSVGTTVITDDYLVSNFAQPKVFYPLIYSSTSTANQSYSQNLVEIKISLGEWSNKAGESIEINDGTLCNLSVVIGGTKPYDVIFNK